MKPGDRVRVTHRRSKLYGLTGHVEGWPGTVVRVRLDFASRFQHPGARQVFSFKAAELELAPNDQPAAPDA